MILNNAKTGIITAIQLKLNAYQNGGNLSRQENEGEQKNFSFGKKKRKERSSH
jgi:hypothetical protein